MAFFPCIYFTGSTNPCYYTIQNINYRGLSMKGRFDAILERSDNRQTFYKLLIKMCANAVLRDIRMVVENPWSSLHYLHNNFLKEPDLIDKDRRRRGDYFSKPTGFWFFNCEHTVGESYQKPEKELRVWDVAGSGKAGLCSEKRSLLSPDYARNFICDFILGKEQSSSEPRLF